MQRLRWRACLSTVLALAATTGAAQSDLADALLHAPDASARTALLHGRPQTDITQALAVIEKSAAARVTAKDPDGAIAAFQVAVEAAEFSGVNGRLAFYCRQIGLQYTTKGRTDLALAIYQKGIGAAEKSGDRQMLTENIHGTAVALRRLSRYHEAEPYAEREWSLVEREGTPQQQCVSLMTYSANLSNLGQVRQALALLEKAADIARKANLEDAWQNIISTVAVYHSMLGENEQGLKEMRDLVAHRVTPNPNDWVYIGMLERGAHRYAESDKAYRTAIAQATAPGAWQILGAALTNLGILEHGQRQLSEAREHLLQSMKIAQEHHSPQLESAALNELSGVTADQGKGEEAVALAGRGLELARQIAEPERLADALIALGGAQESAGRGDTSGDTFTEAISVIEAMRAETPADATALAATLEHWLPAYRGAVDFQMKHGDFAAALRISERAKARVLLDILEGATQAIDRSLTAQERADLQPLRDAVVRARRAYLAKPTPALRRALEDAERPAEAFEQRLYTRHPELVLPGVSIPPLTSEQLAALAPDRRTALLSYFRTADSLAVFVVRAGGKVQAATIKFDDAAEQRLSAFRNLIANRDLDYRPAARSLYDTLIGPVSEALRGADRWIVSPDSSLWDLPFQALVDGAGKHLLETHAITYAPSLSSLQLSRPPQKASLPLLAVAENLPGAGSEAASIARLYGGSVLSGPAASVAAFRQKAADAAVIHIASHAEVDPDHPLESFLALTPAAGDDGALTARQILGMSLRARLVVLSACETARGKIAHGEGILGLGWALAAAGVPATVLSQWKVESEATSALMIDFHRRLKTGVDTAEALRQAELATMRTPGHHHPFYWAAFILTGN